jgi:hypothetical protein
LSNNWSEFNDDKLKPPASVDEAVDRLLGILSVEDKIIIAGMQEPELIELHFSLGMMIRNAFGLHDPGNKLLADCSVSHPDDASGVIIKNIWKKLTTE